MTNPAMFPPKAAQYPWIVSGLSDVKYKYRLLEITNKPKNSPNPYLLSQKPTEMLLHHAQLFKNFRKIR